MSSPGARERGMDSPFTGDSSMSEVPTRMRPSQGTRSPGRTSTRCPGLSDSAETSRRWPLSISLAVEGVKFAKAEILRRAREAATPSSSSPTANKNTTIAASAAALMANAPSAAMHISISMVKGLRILRAPQALCAMGIKPTSVAKMKGILPSAGHAKRSAKATISRFPVIMTKRPLAVCHQEDEAPDARVWPSWEAT